MNILFVSTHLHTGGITSYILTLAREYTNRGHGVVVATSGGDRVSELISCGARHATINIRTKSELSPKVYLSVAPLTRLIANERIDVVHAQTRVTQVLSTLAARKKSLAYVSTCHGFFKRRFGRKLFPCWGQGVIAISDAVREHLTADFGVAPSQIELIYHGIDCTKFSCADDGLKAYYRKQRQLTAGPIIGTLGRLSDVKGYHVLIEAMKDVVARFPRALLLIAGQGKMQGTLKALAHTLGLEKYVQFCPALGNAEEILPLFDVFAMPSLKEGLGLSLLEAQACGIPVVASRVGGIPNVVQNGTTGLLVEPQDSRGLASALIDLLDNPVRAQTMGQAARRFVTENFSVTTMVEKTLHFYTRIIERAR